MRWMVLAALVIAATPALMPPAQAQFGGQMPPEAQAKINAWRTWRENNKNIERLTRTLLSIGELEKDPQTALTKDQAKKIVATIKPWRSKSAMTDDEARQVNRAINSVFTEAQIKALATAPNLMAGGRGFGGGTRPGGGPGGGNRPGGQGGPAFDITKMPDPKPYNPLNPDSSPFKTMSPERHQQMKARFTTLMSKLEAKAK